MSDMTVPDDPWTRFFADLPDPDTAHIRRLIYRDILNSRTITGADLIARYAPDHLADVYAALHALGAAGLITHHGRGLIGSTIVVAADKPAKKRSTATHTAALTVTRCPTCHVTTITGRRSGLDTTLDSDPLTEAGEIHALINRHRTWDVWTPTKYRPRDARRTAAQWPTENTVHRTHDCDRGPVTPGHRRPLGWSPVAPPTRPPLPDNPPF